MSKKSKEKLDVITFGRQLIETEDLDPLYVMLYNAKLPHKKLCRWLVSYWCFYHAGISCQLSEIKSDFFDAMLDIAKGDYPRGTERRHFRGNLAIDSIHFLKSQFSSADKVIDFLLDCDGTTEGAGTVSSTSVVMYNAIQLKGFGEWVKWKVADMLERLDVADIEFNVTNLQDMFKSSKEGANKVCEANNLSSLIKGTNVRSPLLAAHMFLIKNLGLMMAPPSNNRCIDVQETETIFCKWKSHLNGHYYVGKDTEDIFEALKEFDCKTSKLLAKAWMDR